MTDSLERIKAIRRRMAALSTSRTPSQTEALSDLEKLQENVEAYKQFGIEKQKQPWYSKLIGGGAQLLKGLSTVLYTVPRAYSSAGSRLLDIYKSGKTVPQMYAQTPSVYKAAIQGALSSSWYKPEGGKYVDRGMADLFKEGGISQRHLEDIFPGFGKQLEKIEDIPVLRHLGSVGKITPAGTLGLAADIAIDPLTWLPTGLAGKAFNKLGITKLWRSALKNVAPLRGTMKVLSPSFKRGLPKALYLEERFGKKKAAYLLKTFGDDLITLEQKYITKYGRKAYSKYFDDIGKLFEREFDKAYWIERKASAKPLGKKFIEATGKIQQISKEIDNITFKNPEALADKLKLQEVLKKWGSKEYAAGEIPGLLKEYYPGITSRAIKPSQIFGKQKIIGAEKYGRAMPKAFKTFEQARTVGKGLGLQIDTMTETMFKRGKDHFQRMARHGFLDEALQQFGKTNKLAPKGWKEAKGLKQLKGNKFEPEIAEALGRVEQFMVDADIKALSKWVIDAPLRAFKYSATVVNPGFHVRNAISNYWLLFLKDGTQAFNPARMKLGYKLASIEQFGLGKKFPKLLDKVVKIGNKNWTYRELLEEMGRKGVTGGFFGEDIALPAITKAAQPMAKQIGRGVYGAGTKVGGFVEDAARIHGYINDMARLSGKMSVEKASKISAERVWKFLFDYGELTNIEKTTFRRIAPFYTWLRKNLALEVEQLFQQPGKFALMPKLTKFIEGMSEDEVPEEIYMPEYMKKLGAIRLPIKDKDGNTLYLNPNIAWQDINKINDVVDAYSMINPWFRVPFELLMNKNLFFNQEIDPAWGSGLTTAPIPGFMEKALNQIYDKLPKKLTQDLLQIYKTDEGYKTTTTREYIMRSIPFLYSMAKSFPSEAGYKPSTPYRRASWLGGIKLIPYEEEKSKYYKLQEEKAEYEKAVRKLKDLGVLPKDFTLADIKAGYGSSIRQWKK